ASHRIWPEVTAIGHDGGHDLADLIRGAGGAPAHGEEVLAPVQVIIHGAQQFRQTNGRDLVTEPGAEARNAYFDVGADGLRRGRARGASPHYPRAPRYWWGGR